MLTMTNTFHATQCRISNKWGDTPEEAWSNIQEAILDFRCRDHDAARRVAARLHRELCGSHDCQCGDFRPR